MGPQASILSEAVRRCRRAFGLVGVFSLALNLLVLAAPLYMLQVYGRVLSSGRVETLIMLTLMLAVALAAYAAIDMLRMGVTVRVGLWLNQALGPFYLDSVIRERLTGARGGAQAFRDLTTVQSFIATQGMIAFFDFPFTPLIIAVIWVLHPWLGMLALFAVVLLLIISLVNELATRRLIKASNDGQNEISRMVESTVAFSEAVAALGMRQTMADRWSRKVRGMQPDLLEANRRNGMIIGTGKFLRMFFQSAILGLGALLVIRGEATPGVMIAASILLGRALAPVDVAMTAWKSFVTARQAYGRLEKHAREYPPEPRRMSLPRPSGGLDVIELSVSIGGKPVLADVSFSVAPGEAVAVIGPSAAGKSTLCKALARLLKPDAGRVEIDGIDARAWNADELGRNIGYLPQESCLFGGTIRENIARMQDDASDQAVFGAARIAHADDMILRLADGYETVIGDGGIGLSGGQRQRIGLARAIFGVPPLLVLDEPNSNLDQDGEAALAEAILELKRLGSTLLIVGHRPSTLAQADKVLLLRNGTVVDFGPRDEVLGRMRQAAQAEASEAEKRDAERVAAEAAAPRIDRAAEADVLDLTPYRLPSRVAQE